MAIVRTPIVDDDGTGTTGTVLDNAWKQELYGQIDAAIGAIPAPVATVLSNADTGTQNAWTIVGRTANTVVEWNGAADLIVNGIAGGAKGDVLRVKNTGAKVGYFAHAAAAAAAAARLTNIVNSGPTPIGIGGWITYLHDGVNWQLVDHDQGRQITVAFSAAHFAGSAGTWTVEATDVLGLAWRLDGATLTLGICLNTTSVASGGTELRILNTAWGGFLTAAARYVQAVCKVGDNTVAMVPSYMQAAPSAAYIAIYSTMAGTVNWQNATNNTYIQGTLIFEVA